VGISSAFPEPESGSLKQDSKTSHGTGRGSPQRFLFEDRVETQASPSRIGCRCSSRESTLESSRVCTWMCLSLTVGERSSILARA